MNATELQVTALDLKNKTGTAFGNLSNTISKSEKNVVQNVEKGVNILHNSTSTTNTSLTTTPSAKENKPIGQAIQRDVSAKSEIYKMHTNGLMLLHAQRSTQKNGAKKSELTASFNNSKIGDKKPNDEEQESAVNYHVWKKSPSSPTPSLGEQKKKRADAEIKISRKEKKMGKRKLMTVDVVQLNDDQSSITKPNESSIDLNAEEHQRNRIKRETSNSHNFHRTTDTILLLNLVQKNKDPNFTRSKREKRRTFKSKRSTDNPLFDDDQPEEVFKKYTEKRRLVRLQSLYEQADTRGVPAIPPIKPIKNIQSRFDKIEALEHFPRFAPFGPDAYDNWPRYGIPDLTLEHYPRFGAPKMDDFELLPGIPHIRPLSRGDEVTGSKRGYPEKTDDDFYDQELDEDIEHNSPITSPTSIPFLTNIPDIQDIQDIPTIAPAAAVAQKSLGKGEPSVDTIHTKDGDETRVST